MNQETLRSLCNAIDETLYGVLCEHFEGNPELIVLLDDQDIDVLANEIYNSNIKTLLKKAKFKQLVKALKETEVKEAARKVHIYSTKQRNPFTHNKGERSKHE